MTRETRPARPGSDATRARITEPASVTRTPSGYEREVPEQPAGTDGTWRLLDPGRDNRPLRAPGLASGAATRDDRGGFTWLLFLLPIICCGGPFIVAALAAAGALAWGGIGVGVGVAVAVALTVWARRRRTARCCALPDPALGAGLPPGTRGGPFA